MCLLAIAINKKPTLEIIRKAWITNDDGAGIVWVNKDRKVEYIKGIESAEELFNISQATELPFAFHLRLASVGGVNKLLTQPFEISGDSPLKLYNQCDKVLLQNGTDSDWKKCLAASGQEIPLEKDGAEQPMSDTRGIAMILSKHKNFNFLDAASGKFVVVGYRSATDENAFRYFGDFTEDDGIIYSNTFWRYKVVSSSQNSVHFGSQHGHGLHQQSDWRDDEYAAYNNKSKKKDDEIESIVYPYKSFKFFSKAERLAYRRWWKISAFNKSEAPKLIGFSNSKYPVELPPNTYVSPTDALNAHKKKFAPANQKDHDAEQAGIEKDFFSRGCNFGC